MNLLPQRRGCLCVFYEIWGQIVSIFDGLVAFVIFHHEAKQLPVSYSDSHHKVSNKIAIKRKQSSYNPRWIPDHIHKSKGW